MAHLIEQLVDNTEYTGCQTTMFGEPLGGGLMQSFTLASSTTIGMVQFKLVMYSYVASHPAARQFQVDIYAFNPATEMIYGDLLGSTVVSTTTLSLVHAEPQLVDFVFDTPPTLDAGTYAFFVQDVTDGLWGDFVKDAENPPFWITQGIYYLRAAGNEYANGAGYLVYTAVQAIVGDFVFTVTEAEASLALTAAAPLHAATGVNLAPTALTWECTGFDAGTMVFDVYFRMFGVTAFTLVGDGQTELTLTLPDNLAYNFLYFWKVNVRDIATDEILLAGDEWYFNTEALIEYPTPSTRSVPVPAGGSNMTVQTAENCVAAIRYLVAASQNKIWYEYVAGT